MNNTTAVFLKQTISSNTAALSIIGTRFASIKILASTFAGIIRNFFTIKKIHLVKKLTTSFHYLTAMCNNSANNMTICDSICD